MKQKVSCIVMILLLSGSSCNVDNTLSGDDIDDILDSYLVQSELNFSDFFGGEYAVYSGIITQQLSGSSSQMLELDRYDFTPEKTDNLWRNYYLGVLSSLKDLEFYAKKYDYPIHEGISKILMAYTFGLGTDVWGDLPINNFVTSTIESYPTFQSQEHIYDKIFELLDEAIEDFEGLTNQNNTVEADLFYKGNSTQWIQFANFLKLKYSLRIAPTIGWDKLIVLTEGSIMSNLSDTLSLSYAKFINPYNPLFNYLNIYPNQLRAGKQIVDLMSLSNDPRLPVYFTYNLVDEIIGIPAGSGMPGGSAIGSKFSSKTATVHIATLAEQNFILAEVYLKNNRELDAIAAYNEGLLASINQYGVYNEDWYDNNKLETEITLANIMEAKYVALFMSPEVWVDWRRNGVPTLVSSQDNLTGNKIPRRIPYPRSEYNLNPNNVPTLVPIYTPLWWDHD